MLKGSPARRPIEIVDAHDGYDAPSASSYLPPLLPPRSP
jgi:hypothetical protein